ADCRAQRLPEVPQRGGPDFAIAMHFKPTHSKIGVGIVHRIRGDRVSRAAYSACCVICYVLADAPSVVESGRPVIGPAFAHGAGLCAPETTRVCRPADQPI